MDLNIGFLLQGLILGAVAGIMPGPVMMFILSQVLKKGVLAGIKVQVGATLLDVVRILITFFLFSYLPQNQYLIGSIAFVGGIFLLYMAYGNFTYKPQLENSNSFVAKPLLQGMLGNILNAAAYVFWLTVGGPIILSAQSAGLVSVLIFAVSFLVSIFGINLVVILLAGRVKVYLSSKYFVYTIKGLGLILVIFAVIFFNQSYHYFAL